MPTADLLKIVDDAFRAASAEVSFAPTRLYLNLTEVCQLRCAHCITNAPELTANKTARHMSEAVLDQLTPALAHATYVGLVHAGEPMLSPMFEPLLERLREQRGGEPTVVHLLTNGMAMTEERFVDVVERGVRSISFSIDGMREESNDRIRPGSRIAVLKERLPRLASLRAERGLDVRLGVSFTVMADNRMDVPDLVRFVSEAGLDWLKLEEVVPVNAFAREQWLPEDMLREAADFALARGRELGLTVVDHTREWEVLKCPSTLAPDLPEAMRAFSAADDFANRLDINPCRMSYEAVFVEPDGAVKPVSFHHPAVGSLLEEDLETLFNAEPFQLWRRRTGMMRPCGRLGAACERDPGPS